MILYWVMGTSRVWEDPGWTPGLNDAEALAGPGRFFYGFDYGENDWVYVDADDLWHVVAGR